MQYNLQHEFFKELRSLEEQLASETEEGKVKELAQRVTGLVDLLLISVAKSQASYDADLTLTVRDFVDELNQNWGRNLNSFVKSWAQNGYGENDE